MGPRRTRGFTLLEVVLVVVIVGILAAIALPSYLSYIVRANRNAGEQVMQELANREEQYRLDARSYTNSLSALNYTVSTDVSAQYTITIATSGNDCLANAVVAPAYVISAAPVAGSTQAQASEPTLCLDSAGNKTPAAKWQR
jgi:type IV pilus assembly protein PilE